MSQLMLDFDNGDIIQEHTYLRDLECTPNTPVIHGIKPVPIYGKDIKVKPQVPGRQLTEYDRKIHLPELLPLECYGRIYVLFSGGKDSVCSVLNLLELGVPKEKIILLHHDLDGESDKKVDWPVTQAYCKAFAEAFGLQLRFSYREQGFYGELYRLGSSNPVRFEDADGTVKRIEPKAWKRSVELKELIVQAELDDDMEALQSYHKELESYGKRMKFPAKSADLSSRYCSASLKIEVGSIAITYQVDSHENCEILVVSGERRGESKNRSRYNMLELHRTHAPTRKKRIVHHFRNVLEFSERDVWEVLKRNRVVPHPCYALGWGRASCCVCIFSSPGHFKGLKEILPSYYENIRNAEIELNFTLDNKKNLDDYIANATSCLYRGNEVAINQVITGTFLPEDILLNDSEEWVYPAGAFNHAGTSGPC